MTIRKEERKFTKDADKYVLEMVIVEDLTSEDMWKNLNDLGMSTNQIKQMLAANNQVMNDKESLGNNLKQLKDKYGADVKATKEKYDLKKLEEQKKDLLKSKKKIEDIYAMTTEILKDEIDLWESGAKSFIKKKKHETKYHRMPSKTKEDQLKKHQTKSKIFSEMLEENKYKIDHLIHPINKDLWEKFDKI